jgi:RNA recognition motif-containing protein
MDEWGMIPRVRKQTGVQMNIYVGNLPRASSEEELRKVFEPFGEVSTCSIIKDKFTGDSRGFGFVTMSNDTHGQAAIDGLNGKDMGGRALTVNLAKPRTEGGRSSSRGNW